MDQAENLRRAMLNQNATSSSPQNVVTRLENARVITITSGKGGVGKSNLAVNLAICFKELGKRVIILDADFGLANVEVMFGCAPKYNLGHLLVGNMTMKDIVTYTKNGIGFVSGGSGIVGLNNLTKDQIAYLIRSINELNALCDILIIDTGAGVSNSVMEFVLSSPEVILVTTPEPSSLTDSYSLMKALYKSPRFNRSGTNVHLLANKVMSEAEGQAVFDKIHSVVGKFLGGDLDYLGFIPSDQYLERAVRNQKVVSEEYPNSKAAKAFKLTAEKLINKDDSSHFKWGITQLINSFINR